ncbi:MAG: thioredoxin-disulfide reductase [Clostridiales bacterium]|nr:thioredoxin-disulfide reductase [Clostridiales bacterium]
MIDFYDTIIIGAGPAGLTAAIYTARNEKSVLVLESAGIGGQISLSPLVENYPGFEKISGSELSDKLYEQALALGVTIVIEEATRIEVNPDGTKSVYSEAGEIKRSCRKIIIATGQKHRMLGLDNEEKLIGRGVSYCAVCDGPFFKNKTVAVVGGGSSALQSAKLLSGLCQKVYLIHRRDEFRGEQRLANELKQIPNIEFVLKSTIEQIEGDNALTGVIVSHTDTKEKRTLALDGLFIYIGHIPNNEICKGLVSLDDYGYIIAAEDGRTNIDGIYAAGDCRTKAVRQLTTAAADGTVCALAE